MTHRVPLQAANVHAVADYRIWIAGAGKRWNPPGMPWFDVHNHLQDPRLCGDVAIVTEMKAAGVTRCMVNATCEVDWQNVRQLATEHSDFVIPAYGIHPWRADTAADGWCGRLRGLLEEDSMAAIGECGLDGWVKSPAMDCQMTVFLEHLRLNRAMQRPLTIHCLKAWGLLFEAFAAVPPQPGFLMHSFSGSLEIAQRLLDLGAWFSFSGYFLQERKQAVVEVFRKLPKDRILLETDAPDMMPPEGFVFHPLANGVNHPANLPCIGAGLADALGWEVDELMALTTENARRFVSG